MFFFGRNKRKQPEKVPVWFMWLMGAFVAYALLTNLFSDPVSEARKAQQKTRVATEGEQLNFAFVKGVGGAPLPVYTRNIEMGQGDMAGCWYETTVRYRLYDGDGKKIEEITEADEPLRFTIGKGEVIPALERGVMGMRKGGKREITGRPEMAYASEGFSHPKLGEHDFVGYILTMEDIKRPANLPFSDLGLKFYDDKVGDGPVAQCTDTVRVKLRGYDMTGRKLFGERDFPAMMLHIGQGEAPYAIERAVMGMKVGGRRTLIVPPGYLKPLFADAPEQALDAQLEQQVAGVAEAAQQPQEAAGVEPEAETPNQTGSRYAWRDLPVPQDRVIILELDLLPLQLKSQENLKTP